MVSGASGLDDLKKRSRESGVWRRSRRLACLSVGAGRDGEARPVMVSERRSRSEVRAGGGRPSDWESGLEMEKRSRGAGLAGEEEESHYRNSQRGREESRGEEERSGAD
ncbi:unnamed protein product [Linum trigynum]|uniref:Uncharacterized protein n=1 Tax=Linum trigynum TaxID=586398 RepID=A0AAV2FUQ3_9ROSI